MQKNMEKIKRYGKLIFPLCFLVCVAFYTFAILTTIIRRYIFNKNSRISHACLHCNDIAPLKMFVFLCVLHFKKL